MGIEEYKPIAKEFDVPIVVTGFEPLDILEGILQVVKQLENGKAEVLNPYSRVARNEGNKAAQELLKKVFKISDRKWRGIGEIPMSGFELIDDYAEYDAEKIFGMGNIEVDEPQECISGLILQGIKKPNECAAFGKSCTPQSPLGATMVSSEGACSAYYSYAKR